jgi:hypothetical protein
MKRLALAACLTLAACADQPRPTVEFPTLPDLPAEVVKACPPLPMVTGQLGDLATKDASAAVEYARCGARGDTAVSAYQTAQRLLRTAQDAADKQKPSAPPK